MSATNDGSSEAQDRMLGSVPGARRSAAARPRMTASTALGAHGRMTPTGLHLDICENGVKHVTWELTRKQVGSDFFAAQALPASRTPWQWYAEDYDRIRDTMAQVLDGFEDFNVPSSRDHPSRHRQEAGELTCALAE